MSDKPLSEKISEYDGGEYYITAAIWRVHVDAARPYLVETYEIGIRHLKTNQFWLLQSEKYNHQSVQDVANVVATMLACKTQRYEPEFFMEYMT